MAFIEMDFASGGNKTIDNLRFDGTPTYCVEHFNNAEVGAYYLVATYRTGAVYGDLSGAEEISRSGFVHISVYNVYTGYQIVKATATTISLIGAYFSIQKIVLD